MMTDKEYIGEGGNRCPVCGSNEVEGGSFNNDNGAAWQDISCNSCEAEWRDLYSLKGYDLIDKGPKTQLQIKVMKAAR